MPADIGHGAAGYTAIIDQVRHERPARQPVRVRAQRRLRRAQFLRPPLASRSPAASRRSSATNSASPTAARWSAGRLRRPQPHVLLRANIRASGRCWARRRCSRCRRPTSARASTRRPSRATRCSCPVSPQIAPVLARYPLPNDPQGPVRRAHIRHLFEGRARTPTSSPCASTTASPIEAAALRTLQPEQRRRPADEPQPDRHRPVVRGAVFRPPAQRRHLVHLHALGALHLGHVDRLHPLHADLPTLEPDAAGADLRRWLVRRFNSRGGLGDGRVRQPVPGAAESHLGPRQRTPWKAGFEARVQPRHHRVRHQPQRPVHLRRRRGVFAGGIRSRAARTISTSATRCRTRSAGFLTATPFSYTIAVAPPMFPRASRWRCRGAPLGLQLLLPGRMENFAAAHAQLRPALRSELAHQTRRTPPRTSGAIFSSAAQARFLINPQPPYPHDWNGWGRAWRSTGAGTTRPFSMPAPRITTLLPNLWQQNLVTGGLPFVVTFRIGHARRAGHVQQHAAEVRACPNCTRRKDS